MVTGRLTETKFTPEHGHLVLRMGVNTDETPAYCVSIDLYPDLGL